MQNPHLWRISALCAARSLAYLLDMSALAALLRLELHPDLRVLQRSLDMSALAVLLRFKLHPRPDILQSLHFAKWECLHFVYLLLHGNACLKTVFRQALPCKPFDLVG
ncbi:MAG: hypothetical protein Q4C79_00945 [Neisseria sp.]|nr:hypothetical protein [Neisseria sp.]MDO4247526.1 hypothetical protein [Neisseria sp.]